MPDYLDVFVLYWGQREFHNNNITELDTAEVFVWLLPRTIPVFSSMTFSHRTAQPQEEATAGNGGDDGTAHNSNLRFFLVRTPRKFHLLLATGSFARSRKTERNETPCDMVEDHSDDLSLPLDCLAEIEDSNNSCSNFVDNNSTGSSIMSQALHSYFSQLAVEQKADRDDLTIVIDNAHIPFSEECLVSDKEKCTEVFSRSLTALNTLSFPPPFLLQAGDDGCSSRWDSIESRGYRHKPADSDLSPHKPQRTRDGDYDYEEKQTVVNATHYGGSQSEIISPGGASKLKRRLRNSAHKNDHPEDHPSALRPVASLDSASRWLRELPQFKEASLNAANQRSRMLQRRRKSAYRNRSSPCRRSDEEEFALPFLVTHEELKTVDNEVKGDQHTIPASMAEREAMNVVRELKVPSGDSGSHEAQHVAKDDEHAQRQSAVCTQSETNEEFHRVQRIQMKKSCDAVLDTDPAVTTAFRKAPPPFLINGFPFSTTLPCSASQEYDKALLTSSTMSTSSGNRPAHGRSLSIILDGDMPLFQ